GSVKIWSLPMIEKLKSIYYKGLASLRKKQVNVKEH
ncbi:UNVERIFIED_CONTAM: transcriptional regulator, partial [Lactobacillus acidophilus]|nr:transcriptional regulator [Lactobacillus acidophilus]